MSIVHRISERFDKNQMVLVLNENCQDFISVLEWSINSSHSSAWRGAWILNHCLSKNDPRISPYTSLLIECLDKKSDGHQREILKILEKMEIPDDVEGILFDKCISIWENIGKSTSVRIVAFKNLHKTVKKHPELKGELDFLTHPRYTDSLSPGIKRTFLKLANSL